MTIQEIEERKKELAGKIQDTKSMEELEELRSEVDELNNAIPDEEEKPIEEVKEEVKEEVAEVVEDEEELTEEEERKLLRNGDNLKPLEIKEDKNMEERKFTVADPEYRNAWAKKLMGLPLEEIDKRALGDAVGTTATTYVASTSELQGINNVGLLIPTSVVTALLERADKVSPIWRDIRKLGVNGNVDVPYLYASDNANFYAELSATANEGQEYKKITLVGRELAKDIEITWKADQMTVDGFINFIVDELYEKMFKAKVTAVIYGTGNTYNQPSGITLGLDAITTGATPIDTIANTKASLSTDAQVGARVYVSPAVADAIRYYKNSEGNYPFLMGLPAGIEEDPFLQNNDIVVGNMRNYVWNEQEAIRLDRDISIKGRTVIYSAYQVVDGGAKVGAFAYGQYTEVSA